MSKNETIKGYAGLMKRTFQRPQVETFQKRRILRTLVITMIAWYIGVNVIAFSFPAAIWLWSALLVLFFPLVSFINMSVRGVTEIPREALDDRQSTLKLTAFHNSYWLGLVLAIAFGVLASKLWDTGTHNMPFLVGGLGILVGLPAMMLAWTLPDEASDDDSAADVI